MFGGANTFAHVCRIPNYLIFSIVDLLCRLGRVVQGDVKQNRVEENQTTKRKTKKHKEEQLFSVQRK